MTPGWDSDWWGRDPIEQAGDPPMTSETWEPLMKEPTPEDLSYLTDSNIEFCLDYYAQEYQRRNLRKARAWAKALILTLHSPQEDESPRLPSVHRPYSA
jgi:hypothetical protein